MILISDVEKLVVSLSFSLKHLKELSDYFSFNLLLYNKVRIVK